MLWYYDVTTWFVLNDTKKDFQPFFAVSKIAHVQNIKYM